MKKFIIAITLFSLLTLIPIPAAAEVKEKVKGEVEAVVIIIPAKYIQQVVEDCVAKGVKAVIVESGGFAEIGPEGKIMQDKLIEAIQGTDTRIIGPNCVGILSPSFGLDTIFIPLSLSNIIHPTDAAHLPTDKYFNTDCFAKKAIGYSGSLYINIEISNTEV